MGTHMDDRTHPRPVAATVREAMGDLTASERKVARALLSDYPVAGLETAGELAARAGVSTPTVVRFVTHLGFAGYATFQRALRREVHAQMGSPVEQYDEVLQRTSEEGVLMSSLATLRGALDASFHELPASEFDRAVDLLCTPGVRISVVGGRFSHVLAQYLVHHLQLLRDQVTVLPSDEFARIVLVGEADKDDLLVVFDYRRYDQRTVRLAAEARRGGARVLLLTDPGLSPIAEHADVVLPTRVDAPSPFDSLLPAVALVETLVAAVTLRLGEKGRHRVERLEGLREVLDPDAPSSLPPTDG